MTWTPLVATLAPDPKAAHTNSDHAACARCEADGLGGRFGFHRKKDGVYPDDVPRPKQKGR